MRIAILLVGLVLAGMPARAQVVTVKDDQGRTVYINLAPPPAKPAALSTNGAATGAVAPQNTSDAVKRSQLGNAMRNAPADPNASRAISREQLENLITTVATRYSVDPALVRAVMKVESGGNPEAVSHKGAMGLMQLMPDTALQMGVTKVFDPQENLEAGVKTLRALLVRYDGDLDRALAAYNAGTGAVDRAGGVPHIRETRDYVQKVTNNYFQSNGQAALAQGAVSSSGTRTANGNVAGNATSGGNTKSASKAAAGANTASSRSTTGAAPSHGIHQEKDSQGRLVWVND